MLSNRFAWLALAATLGVMPAGYAQTVKKIEVDRTGPELVVHLKGDHLGNPKTGFTSGKTHFDLDFAASLAGRPGRLKVAQDGLSTIRYCWLSAKPRKVRIRLNLQKGTNPVVAQSADGWTIRFAKKGATVAPTIAAPVKVAAAGPAITTPFPEIVPPIATPHAAPAKPVEPMRRVNLECTNTDVVQLLKGLALQSGANLVIGQDVKGTVTVNLRDVSIEQALDYVCSTAGVKYAKLDGTYVVSSESGFDRAMSGLINHAETTSVVHVVPIVSKDCSQVKLALERWFSPATLRVFTPSDSGAPIVAAADPKAETGKADAAGSAAGASATGGNYILLIGDPKWVDAGEKLAREIDTKIVEARAQAKRVEMDNAANERRVLEASSENTVHRAQDESRVRETYEVQGGKASKFKDVLGAQTSFQNVTLYASPEESLKQVLVVEGQPNSVKRAIELLRQLDTGTSGDELLVYEVHFADPRALRESLIGEVPGLRATLAPNSVGNTLVYTEGKTKTQSMETGGQSSTGQPASTSAATTTNGSVSTQSVSDGDLEQPFSAEEKASVPMRLILRGSRSQLEEAVSYLKAVDVAPKQVALELRVMELSKDDAIKAGIDWNILGGGAVKFLRLDNSQANPLNAIGGGFTGKNFTGDITASLDRIANHNNLIARPNVVAMDGRQTEIFVGDIVRYVESITQSQNGTTVTTGQVPVGVRIAVLPRVGAGGTLTMDIRPRMSLLKGFTPVTGGGQLPQTSTRFVQSTISVESGQTIAIGGLIQDQDTKNLQGLPFLMDLPIIGHLFKRTTTSKSRTEIVIFLTAKTLDGPIHSEDHSLPFEKDMKLGKGDKS